MNMIAETLTETDVEQIRVDAKRIAAEAYPSQAAAARDAGIAESTFAAFCSDTYAGDNAKVAAKAKAWLSSRAERAKTAATIPVAPSFQMTPTAAKIIPALQWAQVAPDYVPIIGAPGLGKTRTLEHYAACNANVFLVTMEPAWSSANAMLAALCQGMGLDERSSTKYSSAIRAKVKGLQALIIVDEAQFLSTVALDQLRVIHDTAKVGVVLCGNRQIHTRLYGRGDEANAQLFSRAGMKFHQYQPLAGDICGMVAAWGVTDKAEVAFLKTVGRKPGALRNVDKVMKLASMLAVGGGEPRGLKHIRAAWEQIDVNLTVTAG
ncbi:B transposition protein domain protein [uncultured Alphaproteobacteria bacterium]|uniref:B transposition protein domain protein n=1 Tax=uncultured Alphaproteobacteria bacterium TaxID=91750 RepID=A0A212KC64_9PROT|nr:B transposition protein domain protein [uncultured Alphaproteobacteria bacterium]